MWYARLTKDLELQSSFSGRPYTVHAGTVYEVSKKIFDSTQGVYARAIKGDISELYLTVEQARMIMTKPVRSINEVMEDLYC